MHPDKAGAPFSLSPDKMQKRRIAPSAYDIQKGKVMAHSRNRQSSGILVFYMLNLHGDLSSCSIPNKIKGNRLLNVIDKTIGGVKQFRSATSHPLREASESWLEAGCTSSKVGKHRESLLSLPKPRSWLLEAVGPSLLGQASCS